MKLIIDVSYHDNSAKVVGGFFENWNDDKLVKVSKKIVVNIQEYISGEFYKRELPCILEFLNDYDIREIELIIIDGFVFLNDDDKKGLGAYLFEILDKKIPIIGVAKSSFHNNKKNVINVVRGQSKRPLYVSSIGIELLKASDLIKNMFGNHRIPNIIKIIDTETKE
jgi:deoxyribonuclease V